MPKLIRVCPRCGVEHESHFHYCAACRNLARREKSARVCGKCGERKLLSEFSRSKNASAWCRECCRENAARWRRDNTERARAHDRARAARQRTPEAREDQRLYRLLRKYGLTIEAYNEIMERQGGGCAICGVTPEEASGRWVRLNVDHDHASGEVRGILCHNCNAGLGHFKDDPDLLRAAIHYLLGEPVGVAHIG